MTEKSKDKEDLFLYIYIYIYLYVCIYIYTFILNNPFYGEKININSRGIEYNS